MLSDDSYPDRDRPNGQSSVPVKQEEQHRLGLVLHRPGWADSKNTMQRRSQAVDHKPRNLQAGLKQRKPRERL
jgi:hypothetical protein